MQHYGSSWAQLKPCSGERPRGGDPTDPTQGTGTVGVCIWDWEEPSWGPGIQSLTITTSFSDAEMLNSQERDCETSHPNPKARDSSGCSVGFPETPHG